MSTIVFNVAAISSYWRNTANLIYKVNVDGARNVFEAAARSGVRRVVHTSSAAAVGIIKDRSATEADPFNQSPPAVSLRSQQMADGSDSA